MPLDPHALLARPFAPVHQTYTAQTSMLYALSCGVGADPLDAHDLRYVYERAPGGLQALPTLANVLGYAGFWADQPDTGITWQKLVHVEQSLQLHGPLPAAGSIIGHTRVTALHDKGTTKGALMRQTREIVDSTSGALLASVVQTTLLRGDGGFGAQHGASHGEPLPAPCQTPSRAPDAECRLPVLPQAALLYRLNGDANPLHADPAVAQAAGFTRPILHGLCTMGMALHAVLRTCLAGDASAVRGMRVRFTAPVLPGETLCVALWRQADGIALRASVAEREVVVLDGAHVTLA